MQQEAEVAPLLQRSDTNLVQQYLPTVEANTFEHFLDLVDETFKENQGKYTVVPVWMCVTYRRGKRVLPIQYVQNVPDILPYSHHTFKHNDASVPVRAVPKM